MGMYDTLNGEQVKCFPWFSFYVSAMDTKGVVTSHGGDLKYYGNGSEIPYRSRKGRVGCCRIYPCRGKRQTDPYKKFVENFTFL